MDILYRNAHRHSLVLNEGLKLSPGPAVQAGSHARPGLDPLANVREVFHYDFGCPDALGFFDNRLARFVVDVLYAPRLFARDLPKLLFSALAAVGLKTTAKSKVTIAPVAQSPAAKDLASACGSEVVFSNIHAHHRTRLYKLQIVRFDDEVEKPLAPAKDQIRLLGFAGANNAALMFAKTHGDYDMPIKGIEKTLALEKIGLVKMDAGAIKVDFWDWSILPDAPQCFLRLVRFTDREDDIVAYLAVQRGCLAQHRVGAWMQRHSIPEALLTNKWNKTASIGISRLQRKKPLYLVVRDLQLDRRRAHHRLSPLDNMLRSLDVAAEGFGADIACRTDVVRRRPLVGRSIDAITVCDYINHVVNHIPHGALRSAIPPAAEVAVGIAKDL